MTIPPALGPVYLRGPKGRGEAELWVRVGNFSTRRLDVTDAVQYVAMRWPAYARVSLLTRLRLTLTPPPQHSGPPAAGRRADAHRTPQ